MLAPFDVAIADKAAALNAVMAMFPIPDGIEAQSVEALSEAAIAELGLTAGEIRQR